MLDYAQIRKQQMMENIEEHDGGDFQVVDPQSIEVLMPADSNRRLRCPDSASPLKGRAHSMVQPQAQNNIAALVIQKNESIREEWGN